MNTSSLSDAYVAMIGPLPAEQVAEQGWAPDMLVTLHGERVWLRPRDGGIGACCHEDISMFCPRHRTTGVDPNACQWCGQPERLHGSRWVEFVGRHQWTAPTDGQRLARMRARRSARSAA